MSILLFIFLAGTSVDCDFSYEGNEELSKSYIN